MTLGRLAFRVNSSIIDHYGAAGTAIVEQNEHRDRRRLGRPLSFDRDAALTKAMHLFWQHGYETTSVAELTAAMGITPPSLYAAFGDKRRLFLEAVDRYTNGGAVTALGLIQTAATARDAALSMLRGSAIAFTGADTPAGCLVASAAVSCSDAAADVRAHLAGVRLDIETALRDKAGTDVATGLLPADTDPAALAATTMAVIQGMSTLAKDGADRSKLLAIAETALQTWPSTEHRGSTSCRPRGDSRDDGEAG